jgi:hypothetical protein
MRGVGRDTAKRIASHRKREAGSGSQIRDPDAGWTRWQGREGTLTSPGCSDTRVFKGGCDAVGHLLHFLCSCSHGSVVSGTCRAGAASDRRPAGIATCDRAIDGGHGASREPPADPRTGPGAGGSSRTRENRALQCLRAGDRWHHHLHRHPQRGQGRQDEAVIWRMIRESAKRFSEKACPRA